MFRKVIDKFFFIIKNTAGLLLICIVSITLLQVISRTIKQPIPWTEELLRYLFVWMVFIGSIIVFKEDKHLAPGLNIINRLPLRVQKIFKIFSLIFVILCDSLLFYYGLILVSSTLSKTAITMPIPMALIWIVIPFSTLITFALIVNKGYRLIIEKKVADQEVKV